MLTTIMKLAQFTYFVGAATLIASALLFTKNTVAMISTATYKAISEIAVGSAPNDVAILPNGKYAYVCNSDDNTVTVIDIRTD